MGNDSFICPKCGDLAQTPKGLRTIIKCTTGLRRIRACPRCLAKMITFQPEDKPEKLVRVISLPRKLHTISEVENELKRLNAPDKVFEALENAKRKAHTKGHA